MGENQESFYHEPVLYIHPSISTWFVSNKVHPSYKNDQTSYNRSVTGIRCGGAHGTSEMLFSSIDIGISYEFTSFVRSETQLVREFFDTTVQTYRGTNITE
jgi:hypothetical protein